MDHNLGKARELGFQLFPKPMRHQLNCGIFETRDVVEDCMIELSDNWLHRGTDLGVVVNPARRGIDLTFNRDFDGKGVTVHVAALVTLGSVREKLSSFENEIFRETGFHWSGVLYNPAARTARDFFEGAG